MLTKQEKERLTAAERSYWKDERMVKHCVSRALLFFDLRGKIFTIEKRDVNTNFCFGYHDYGDFNYDAASDMAAYARQNQLYFLRENHKSAGYAERIHDLDNSRYIVYARPNYTGDCPELYEISFIYKCDYDESRLPQNSFILTDDEKALYKRKLTEACKLHHKKLEAYLKRYGLSKVRSWTYWADE